MTNASTRVGSAVVFVSLLAMGLGGAANASTLRTADESPPTCAGAHGDEGLRRPAHLGHPG